MPLTTLGEGPSRLKPLSVGAVLDLERPFQATGVCSSGVLRIPHLQAFLPESRRLVRVRGRAPRALDSIAGWGMKSSALRARRLAERRGLPYLALEDGFIRALGPAAEGYPPSSLVVDPVGIYYDATRASALELLLEGADDEPLPLDEAKAALAAVLARGFSKTNTAPHLGRDALALDGKPLVLVIDQTLGDMSVELGLAGSRHFEDMLDAAQDENLDATVMVKLHPEAIAGRRRGYLAERARARGLAVIDQDVNPLSLVGRARRVYTVTSQLGMEALLCGTRVTCFGMPFYAGWGATDDRVSCPRRTRRRAPLEIFALAYLRYARYVDPIRGEACTLGRWLERLAVLKSADERSRGHTECLGFARWKRRHVAPFLRSSRGTLGFAGNPRRALARAAAGGGRLCSWASRTPAGLEQRAEAAGVPLVRVEDGFLRSVGLGSDFLPAASLVFDHRGIYYDASRPSALEEILEFERFDQDLLDAARRLRRQLIEGGLSKYNQGGEIRLDLPAAGRRRILVPGQVEDDASVRLGGGAIQSNGALLEAVRERCPDACLIFKPHPDVESGSRHGRLADRAALRHCDAILRRTNADAAIAAVDEVHTLTSLLGFEALLRGVPVVTYGLPFYAGWGLTEDRLSLPRRSRRLSLDELVAGALILYPAYVDPVTGLACDAETVASRLAAARRGRPRRQPAGRPWLRQLLRGLRALALAARPQGVRSAG